MTPDKNPIHASLPKLAYDERLVSIVDEQYPRKMGFAIVLVAFLLFGIWAVIAPLAQAVVAPGVVKVELDRRVVQHLEGGIIKQIHIQDGAMVKRGDLLLTLDAAQFHSDKEVNDSQLLALLVTEARLRAERDGLAEIPFPDEIDRADPRIAEVMSNEMSLFNARRNSRRSETNVLRERVKQAESQIAGLTQVDQRKSEVRESLQTERADLSKLMEKNFISRHKLLQAERQVSELESDIAENNAKIASQRVQQKETELQIEFRNAEYKSQVVNSLTDVQKRIDELRKKLLSINDRVDRAEIRAPVSGKVIGLKVNTPGGVLAPGTHILDIVPEGANLQIEAHLSPNDINTVRIGQSADIRLTSFKATTTPVIEGTVTHLAGDRLIDERTGAPYFECLVELTPASVEVLAQSNLKLQPGIPADVIIKTGERTMMQYITQPLSNALAQVFREK